ncbi:MAG: hypothetical protein HS111_15255 [Kofleriaceae bacterium]|nr:hypothetical protein [Kofleriaceae bacterium]MCL4229027.1 hypothetical protein [Myxococcales bacterium]
MRAWIQMASGRLADFTIGTVIVMVHVALADRERRRAASVPPQLKA